MILLNTRARASNDALPYHLASSTIHSLSWLCIIRLAEFPDQIYQLPVRLRVNDDTLLATDIARAVHHQRQRQRLIDPRLWATLAQIYDNLPSNLSSFNIPLADPHLILLQRIPATPRFSLLTILDLPACPHLTDDTVTELVRLHSLAALDASATALSSYAVTVLARTLQWSTDNHSRGLWNLRILRLRDCAAIEDTVYPQLARFPLLSIIDLRGTKCTPPSVVLGVFRPADETQLSLYHPSSLYAALHALTSHNPLYSSPHVFTLQINTLHHGPPPSRSLQSSVAPQDTFVVIPSLESGTRIITGSSEVLLRRNERAEEHRLREENKEAWYARNPQYNPKFHQDDADTTEMSDLDDLSDSDDDGKSFQSRSSKFRNLLALPTPPFRVPKRERRTHQRPVPSSSNYYHIAPDFRRPTTFPSSSWIGTHSQAAKKPPLSLPVRPMPRSSFPTPNPPAPRPLVSASTAAFYSTLPTKVHPQRSPEPHHPPSWDWHYSADRYYSKKYSEKTEEHDTELMLYRQPPPWSNLLVNQQSTRGKAVSALARDGILRAKHVERLAPVIDQKRIEAVREREGEKQAALVALQESAKRHDGGLSRIRSQRWHQEKETSSPTLGNNATSGTTMGRNPFRRRVPASVAEAGIETTKPLKPISAVKIPLLPVGALGRETKRRKTIPDVEMSESPAVWEQTSRNSAVIVTPHKLRPWATCAFSEDEKATRAKPTPTLKSDSRTRSSKVGYRAGTTATPDNKTNVNRQEFNWSKWSIK